MEASGITSFKRRAVSNASEQLVLLIEQEKKVQREKRERRKREEKKEDAEVGVGTRGDSSGHEVSLVTAGTDNIRARP